MYLLKYICTQISRFQTTYRMTPITQLLLYNVIFCWDSMCFSCWVPKKIVNFFGQCFFNWLIVLSKMHVIYLFFFFFYYNNANCRVFFIQEHYFWEPEVCTSKLLCYPYIFKYWGEITFIILLSFLSRLFVKI